MRLFTLLILLFGIAQTNAYSVPGGYERVLIYYLYSIDCQLNGGKAKQIATGCSRSTTPCTLDQLLRYIADEELPARLAPATTYPALPPMDATADALIRKDQTGPDAGKSFSGPIDTGRALPGASSDYSKFLSALGDVAVSFAYRSPDNANLLKQNLQAIRNARRNAQLTTFMPKNPDITPHIDDIPLYDGAPNEENNRRRANVMNARLTVQENPGLTLDVLTQKWSANTKGNHFENVQALGRALKNMENACTG